MIKETLCKECANVLIVDYYCDTCETKLTTNGHFVWKLGMSTSIELGVNGTEYDFCNYQCLLKFILEELKKENKQ
jgi:hypothetical protein